MTSSRASHPSSPWVWHGLGFLALLIAYFAVPYGSSGSASRAVIGVAVSLLAVAAAGWVISRQVRVALRGTGRQVRLRGLLLLLELIVVAFAAGYFVLARSTDGQIAGIETRLDALYFTLSTVSTVGFGDVHATGQAGRAVVCLQIGFNVIFVGALASLMSGRVRSSASVLGELPRTSSDEDD